ncbi:MAG: hypothetical protein ACYTBX_06465 [Planctomycetota bacterium]|jgi:hypothetical protein
MEGLAKSAGMMKQLDTGNSLHSFWINISKNKLLDKLLFFIKAVVEYAFGMQIGFAVGWLIGLCVGKSFVGHFEPVYLDDLSQLSYWRSMPYGFARNGAIIGLAVGVIVITTINNKLLSQRVISLYKKGRTDPKGISRALYESDKQIQRVINNLAKKGKISMAEFK